MSSYSAASPADTRGGFFHRLIATDGSGATALLRITLAIIMFPHGAQKVLGWFGGYGFTGTMGFFTGQMKIPYIFALLAIIAEFLGAIGLLVGLLTRVAAFGIACVMVVAVATTHLPNGFFMNWTGQQKGEGFEYHLLVIAIAVFLMIRGAGAASLDRMLSNRR
ncbi:MAG TPA: DoxX family protein [Longimicrobiaceae bacterium]|jgi:putative oxidoreductase|nr:DoxX family protein [Longimicrobiaceae bacterium]